MTATADIRAGHSLEQGFRLGELRIEPHDGKVTGPGGAEQLDPKVMNVLLLLAEHAGHVVSRNDLLSRLWPNTVVTDDVLSRCIYELRQQLSQAGGDEQLRALIETVPKRGYRLNCEVTPLPAAVGRRASHSKRAWLTVEPLPGYAPELNPVEQVWGNVKGGELANVCADDLAGLRHADQAAVD